MARKAKKAEATDPAAAAPAVESSAPAADPVPEVSPAPAFPAGCMAYDTAMALRRDGKLTRKVLTERGWVMASEAPEA